jgi:methionine synthase II (cobalamin-independent)
VTTKVHFVGSIALDSTREVFEVVGETLKPLIKRCPDGEIGPRRLWVSYQWPLLRATSFLEIASDTAIPGAGLCTLRVKADTPAEEIRFGELGYAREARTSYADFLAARQRGTLAPDTRFQVCLPTPAAVIGAFLAPADIPRVLPAYAQAMSREVQLIAAAIPHRDLAIQWDVCIEMIQWDGRFPGLQPIPNMRAVFEATFAQLSATIPADVELGFHLCYGDLDAKHFVEPLDLGKAVELANLLVDSSARRVNWIHMPVPINRDDAAFFAPLKQLHRWDGTELYLGVVHAKDGAEGAVRRMRAASAFAEDFGIATECGIGRARTRELARKIMAIHAQAAEAFSG